MLLSRANVNARRHALINEYRRKVMAKYDVTPFPHQAEWMLASEGWVLTDQAPSKGQPSELVMLDDESIEPRLIIPRPGGPAHALVDLAGFKGGKSFSLAMFASGFAGMDGAGVDFIGMQYDTCEPEFNYLIEFLLSERGMSLPSKSFRNHKKDGAMWVTLENNAHFEVKSYLASRKSETMKGKTRDAYIFCEAYQLPGLHVYSHVSQNLRERDGFAAFATTPDRAWVRELHDKGHGKDPYWHCPTPDMRILTADLRWKPAGEMRVGDKLVGFDEYPTVGQPGAGRGLRRFRTAYVTHASRDVQACMKVTLSDGTVVTVSREHQWLAIRSKGAGKRVNKWIETQHLKPGMKLRRWFNPWETRDNRDGGYLSGFYDGEGHITKLDFIQPLTIGAAQKQGPTLDRVLGLLTRLGYQFRTYSSKRSRDEDCLRFFINGAVGERARFLGEVRPERLIDKFQPEMLGALHSDIAKLEVVSVEECGNIEVVRLSTDTQTYILEGLASHNCTCEIDASCNPFTFDQAARDRDDPDKGGLMTRERFAVAWGGKVNRHIGAVYDYEKGAQMFSPLNAPQLFTPESHALAMTVVS